jgi:lactate 2-monooxygenase
MKGQGIAQYTSDPVFCAELKQNALGPTRSTPRSPLNLRTIATALEQKANFPGGLLRNMTSGDPLAAVQRFMATYSRPSLQWEDLKFLRAQTKLPIVLKGVLHPDDARKALEHGMDGLIVSNHGGRQLDGEIASLEALPTVAEAVNGRIPVLFDSGVRGGADVFKALALGATAVCLGRPYVYGLAIAGQRGVAEVIGNVLAEFDLTLGLSGRTRVSEINRQALA